MSFKNTNQVIFVKHTCLLHCLLSVTDPKNQVQGCYDLDLCANNLKTNKV